MAGEYQINNIQRGMDTIKRNQKQGSLFGSNMQKMEILECKNPMKISPNTQKPQYYCGFALYHKLSTIMVEQTVTKANYLSWAVFGEW